MFQALKLSFILALKATFFLKIRQSFVPITGHTGHIQHHHLSAIYTCIHSRSFDVKFLTLCQLHFIKSGSVHFYTKVNSANSIIV
jgi:hypothetical protein